jgi:hypothetical protein
MQSRNEIKNELVEIRRQLEAIGLKEGMLNTLASKDSEDTSRHLLKMLELIIKENMETRHAMNEVKERLTEMEDAFFGSELDDAAPQGVLQQDTMQRKLTPLSTQDVKILQFIQLNRDMACADDIRGAMNYRGRNAASARLKRLQGLGLLERIQMGHKVYYKYDAGKATNLLIVSPPQ